jgi:hypothetical protein
MVVESLDRLGVCEARVMDRMESGHPALGGPGNVFYFVADLAAATAWYSARLDPFGNLFGLRQPPA